MIFNNLIILRTTKKHLQLGHMQCDDCTQHEDITICWRTIYNLHVYDLTMIGNNLIKLWSSREKATTSMYLIWWWLETVRSFYALKRKNIPLERMQYDDDYIQFDDTTIYRGNIERSLAYYLMNMIYRREIYN